jgi:hypothetical protein
METPNDTERNRHYVTVNVDSERKDPPTQPGGFFFAPKKRPQHGGALKAVLLRAMPGRPSMVLIVS